MQSKDELEQWYNTPDPWGYETNPDDTIRRDFILNAIPGKKYKKALDIGCGEGWITQFLPARVIHGLELSEQAQTRFPASVLPVDKPVGKYDLVITTGTLYPQYNHQQILEWIKTHASKHLLIAGIKDWFVDLSELGEPIYTHEFKYRDYVQEVRVYDRRIS